MKTHQPPDEKCEFCGATLHHEGLVLWGSVIMWSPFAGPCTCEPAQRRYKERIAQEEREEQERKRLARQQITQAKIDRLIGNSGIKRRFQQRTFDTFRTDTRQRAEAFRTAKEYADNFEQHAKDGTGLYIEGTNGTGKTHLAAAIAMKLITEKHIPVICKTAGDLLQDIKKAYDTEGATEAEVLGVYKEVDLLIIDDLGKEQCTDWSISTLYNILNDRYEEMRPTIITTNYDSASLVKALTPKGYDSLKVAAIISRLQEVSRVMTMAWEDARTNK